MEYSDKYLLRQSKFSAFAATVSHKISDKQKADFEAQMSRPGENAYKIIVDRSVERSHMIASAQNYNGADLFVDRYLRNFLREANSRILKGMGAHLPASFNTIRAFVELDTEALVMKMLPELHYSATLMDVAEYISNPSTKLNHRELINEIPELLVHEFNMLGGFSDFKIPGHEAYALCGVGFVREHDELTIIAVMGRENPHPKINKVKVGDGVTFPDREFLLDGRDEIDFSDDSLFGNDAIIPLILSTRIDLARGAVQVRYLFEEKKEGFIVLTDDPEVFDASQKLSGDTKAALESVKRLKQFDDIFNFMMLIPFFSRLIRECEENLFVERRPTKFKIESNSTYVRKMKARLAPGEAPNYVDTYILRPGGGGKSLYNFPDTDIKMETNGFWKTLPFGAMGADKNGRPVQGKTWVTQQYSWVEQVGISQDNIGSSFDIEVASGRSESGYVYVLRSSLHPKDVYKIGFTTKHPDERSAQLTSTSGQPDMFNVIEFWHVLGPRQVEQHVHGLLREFRVNPSREFFKIKYRVIRSSIEKAIENFDCRIDD